MRPLSYISRWVKKQISKVLDPINPFRTTEAGLVLLLKESREEYRQMSTEEFVNVYLTVKKAIENPKSICI